MCLCQAFYFSGNICDWLPFIFFYFLWWNLFCESYVMLGANVQVMIHPICWQLQASEQTVNVATSDLGQPTWYKHQLQVPPHLPCCFPHPQIMILYIGNTKNFILNLVFFSFCFTSGTLFLHYNIHAFITIVLKKRWIIKCKSSLNQAAISS